MKKQFLGYSTKSWLKFLIAAFVYGGFMGWFTDFTTTQISISAAFFAGIYTIVENKFFSKSK